MTAFFRGGVFISLIVSLLATAGCKHKSVESAARLSAAEGETERFHERFLAQQFRESVAIFDQSFREPRSGLFYDRISLGRDGDTGRVTPSENLSSAATGMGLVALALGDVAGVVDGAQAKIKQALMSLEALGRTSVRSPSGWFLHWFRPDGSLSQMSHADGYSTIDTTILLIGASIAADYLGTRYGDHEAVAIAERLAASVNWDEAITSEEQGAIALSFPVSGGVDARRTLPFNEYALIPCFAKGRSEKLARMWKRHFANPATLPTKRYDDLQLLTDHPDHFIPHFTLQFAYYLCGSIRENVAYQRFIADAYRADRLWGEDGRRAGEPLLWGQGAGSAFMVDGATQSLVDNYEANSFSHNPMGMASPHIMAGFLPFDKEAISEDLVALDASGYCRYQVGEQTTLWRCSRRELGRKVEGIEAVDYATMVFGLSTVNGGSTATFFSTYGL